jgi:hypothetical protein
MARAFGLRATKSETVTTLRKIWTGDVYNCGIAEWVKNLRQHNPIDLEIVKRPEAGDE